VFAMLLAKYTPMIEMDLVELLRRELSARPVMVFLYGHGRGDLRSMMAGNELSFCCVIQCPHRSCS
jgi:hypothetical protein